MKKRSAIDYQLYEIPKTLADHKGLRGFLGVAS